MAINDRIDTVLALLNRVRDYNRLIITDNFEADTVTDMKGNAKDICDKVKDEITAIKIEIDTWS